MLPNWYVVEIDSATEERLSKIKEHRVRKPGAPMGKEE